MQVRQILVLISKRPQLPLNSTWIVLNAAYNAEEKSNDFVHTGGCCGFLYSVGPRGQTSDSSSLWGFQMQMRAGGGYGILPLLSQRKLTRSLFSSLHEWSTLFPWCRWSFRNVHSTDLISGLLTVPTRIVWFGWDQAKIDLKAEKIFLSVALTSGLHCIIPLTYWQNVFLVITPLSDLDGRWRKLVYFTHYTKRWNFTIFCEVTGCSLTSVVM